MNNVFCILLVDDNENNLFTLAAILQDLKDVKILQSLNAQDALKQVVENEVNLMILDIQMPETDGYELAKILKTRKKTMNIPIIFATAIFKTEEFIEKGYLLGAIDYIFKPISPLPLLNKVNYYKEVYKKNTELYFELIDKNEYLQNLSQEMSKINNELSEKNDKLETLSKELIKSEMVWRTTGENLPDLVCVLALDGIVEISNERTIFDDRKVCNGSSIFDYFPTEYHDWLSESFSVIESQGGNFSTEFMIVKNGIKHWSFIRIASIGYDTSEKYLFVATDITVLKENEEKIRYLGLHDNLTGISNRHAFEMAKKDFFINKYLPLTVMMLDMNGLKLINDVFGHTEGDNALKFATKKMQSFVRNEDFISRIGGDEFVLIFKNMNKIEAENIKNRILMSFNEEMESSKDFLPNMSVGHVTIEEIDGSIDNYLSSAEFKMYENKLHEAMKFRKKLVEILNGKLHESDYREDEHINLLVDLIGPFCEFMNYSGDFVQNMELLSKYHDVGKITIPKKLRLKTGKLTTKEYEVFKNHSDSGHRITKNILELSKISEFVLYHHENFDGTGYPTGKSGNEIPVESKILNLIDSFSVMVRGAIYKEAITIDDAIEEIKVNTGTQFDPEISKMFLDFSKTNEFKNIVDTCA